MALVLAGLNFYSLLYTTFFTLCSGFVLISSAAGPNSNLKYFSPGEKIVYKWTSTVLLNEIEGNTKTVGFSLEGKVVVSSVWGTEETRILKLELVTPNLRIQSRRVPSNDFKSEPSPLDSYKSSPFIVVLNRGTIEKLLIAKEEQIALKNIKKGIAGLFQFQSWGGEISESDASGHCNVSYTSTTTTNKHKSSCIYDDLDNLKHSDKILGTSVISTRVTEYTEDDSNALFTSIVSKESHNVLVHAQQELGSTINSEQILTYTESQNCDLIEVDSVKGAIDQLSNEGNLRLSEESMLTGLDSPKEGENMKFSKEVGQLRGSLNIENLGSVKSAKALLKLVDVARTSSSEEISKTLSSKKNEKILFQLYDILGYAQTSNSHKAVMKHLHIDNEEHSDFIERYLWALSFSTHPDVNILEDLLNKYRKYTNIPDHIRDTLILSLASMARTISHSQRHDYDTSKVLRTVEETIVNGFDYAKDENRYVFINALKNLKSPSTLPKLMTVIQNENLKEEVLAWRALRSFDKVFWTPELLKQAEKTLYQLDKKHDTSSRTIAVDILLTSGVNDATLKDLLHFVASNETNFEIKQYVFQSIKMLSEKCELFNQRVTSIIKTSKWLNNYSSLSPRGLSTALTRNIFNGLSANGSLVSVQEIKSGIVKRGVVDVVLDKDGISKELFTLGIFAGGLSSFVSSNSDEEEEEASTAGMELSVMGTQLRPFIFFEGNGELMGHVWSGTASEMTSAFQALILAQDHEEYLRLGNGFIVEINLKGAVSFDLSGKIEISIWNRNSQSLMKKSVGYASKGLVKIDTPFIKSQVAFEGSIEPKLSLEIDADFSSNVKLCMRLSQPDSIFRHEVTKFEAVPGNRHQLKLALSRKKAIPGITYALNRKNSEMCSSLFS